MKPLSNVAFNYGFSSRQRIRPKQFNWSAIKADDFLKNAKNGIVRRFKYDKGNQAMIFELKS